MNRAYLPFHFLPSTAVVELFGNDLNAIAVLAVKAVIRQTKSLEIAHQQFVFRAQHIALSTRISSNGGLIVELDIGDPRLADRIVLEDDLRRAVSDARSKAGVVKGRHHR